MSKTRYISPLDFQRQANRSEGRNQLLAIQKALGTRVAQLRKAKQASQEAFAYSCGLHRSHMGEIERGESNFTLGTLLLLAKQLGITIFELFKGVA